MKDIKALIILGLFIFINLFEACFCEFSKKHASNRQDSEAQSNGVKHDKSVIVNLILDIYSWINSFTFLYFKIVGYVPSHHIRLFLYRYVFRMTIGKGTIIYYGLEARNPWNITIGKNCSIGDKAILDARKNIVIADNVNISTGAWIWTVQHDVNSESFSTTGQEKPVYIGEYAWISSRTSILPGANVLKGDIIAAGAILTKPCNEHFCIYGGVPAKKIGLRNDIVKYRLTEKHRHFY
ncbi:acyltransferase [Butyrivibrio sp. MB2005]|uniref:acyltransferase n=1 Tax=Butyrivibrio sp. MB2005 TaxID=1280678 RepID=UPI0003FB0D23|nr:acyltransferase [Butyrivibrio sp. MB2005]